ncbi:thiol-disulfide oxidoreductase DCC family protein [Roseospira goensis]|uniref:Putative DCC family thiol-disulfide oxidoreductase YuxK n=1 Tax=Roseospira goensis TaxID=391922 RepID=A0A7W6RY88_9PROT|nr:DUF393 domain-containing protein [Roseospira goensis]MBB4284757.1 putative DCC family thiol-disulfide oxidoreductase YuxK [Roseospira goensis]
MPHTRPAGSRASDGGPALTTYYNGACPICRTEIEHYQGVDQRHDVGLAWQDVSQGVGGLAIHGIDPDTATRRLYAIDAHGHLHAGVDAFILVWSQLPGYRWLARVVALPGVRQLAGVVYEGVLAPLLYRWNRWRRHRAAGNGR